nr:Myb-like protein [Ipomoea batatas]
MATSSNRSPSPVPLRPHRRSFSGSPSPKPFPLTNPRRSFNPITPANSPADSGRRGFPVKEEDFAEKENERAAKLRSPAKGSKNFMSPTISAASKICASPKKKVLVDRNEPVRSSITLCDGKATFFSSISSESTEYSKPKPEIPGIPGHKEDVLQGHPVTKALKRVKFAEVPLYCENVSDSLSETVLTDSDCFTAETSLKNISSCSTLSSPSTNIAPLDADPSPSPYDPKTNYLSPRPQFLHYRPNPRIDVLRSLDKGGDMGEPKLLDESFMSEIVSENSDSESQMEDSQKESEDSSSSEAEVVVESAVEETEVVEEPKFSEEEVVVVKSLEEEVVLEPEIDETEGVEELDSEVALPVSMPGTDEMAKEIPDVRKETKRRFYIHSKLFYTIFLVMIACLSISVTDSPILNGYGVKDLKLTNISYLGSQISVLFQSTLNDQLKGSSGFSPVQFVDITADLEGGSKWELEEDREFEELDEDELDNDVEPEKMVEKAEEDEDFDSDVEVSEEEEYENPGFGDSSEMEFGEKLEFEIEVKEDNAKAEEAEFELGNEVEEDVGSAEAYEGEVYSDFGANMEIESKESFVLEAEDDQNQKQELIASRYDSVKADDLVAAASQDFDIKTEAATPTDIQPEAVEVVKFQGDDNANPHTELETALLDANLESKTDDSRVEKPSTSEMLASTIQQRSSTILGISSFLLGAVAVAAFVFLKQKNNPADPCLPKNLVSSPSAKHIVQEKQSSEDWEPEADVVAESCPSEMSSFEVSTSHSRKDAAMKTSRAQKQERKPSKSSSSRRESVAASSDYSLGSPSPSYGSFTTYERIPIKHVLDAFEIPSLNLSGLNSSASSPHRSLSRCNEGNGTTMFTPAGEWSKLMDEHSELCKIAEYVSSFFKVAAKSRPCNRIACEDVNMWPNVDLRPLWFYDVVPFIQHLTNAFTECRQIVLLPPPTLPSDLACGKWCNLRAFP